MEDPDTKQITNLKVQLQILQVDVKRGYEITTSSFPDRSVDASSLTLPFMTTDLMGGGSLGVLCRANGRQNPFALTNLQSS